MGTPSHEPASTSKNGDARPRTSHIHLPPSLPCFASHGCARPLPSLTGTSRARSNPETTSTRTRLTLPLHSLSSPRVPLHPIPYLPARAVATTASNTTSISTACTTKTTAGSPSTPSARGRPSSSTPSSASPAPTSPPNHIHDDAARRVVEKEFKEEQAAGRLFGPFLPQEVEQAIGFFRTSPLSVREKSTQGPNGEVKYRIIEDLSHRPDDEVPSVNDAFWDEEVECEFVKFAEAREWFREVASDKNALVFGLDLAKAFYHVPVAPGVRHHLCLLLDGHVYIRAIAPFGLRSSPAVFLSFARCTLLLLARRFGEKVKHLPYMDDLVFALLSGCRVASQAIVDFLKELGWQISEEKMQQPGRIVTHVGIEWNLDTKEMRLPMKKREKYLGKVEKMLEAFRKDEGVKEEELQSLVGSLRYVGHILPSTRSHLAKFYGFLRGYTRPHSRRRLHWTEKRELDWWKKYLSESPLTSSFAPPIHSFPVYFTADASGSMLGIYIRSPPTPTAPASVYTQSFPLLPDWRTRFREKDVDISHAEAWAFEALLEAAIRMGARSCRVKLRTDNMLWLLSLKKGWSADGLRNAAIAQVNALAAFYSLTLDVEYIASAENEADAVSRGEVVPGALPLPFTISTPCGSPGGLDPYSHKPAVDPSVVNE